MYLLHYKTHTRTYTRVPEKFGHFSSHSPYHLQRTFAYITSVIFGKYTILSLPYSKLRLRKTLWKIKCFHKFSTPIKYFNHTFKLGCIIPFLLKTFNLITQANKKLHTYIKIIFNCIYIFKLEKNVRNSKMAPLSYFISFCYSALSPSNSITPVNFTFSFRK